METVLVIMCLSAAITGIIAAGVYICTFVSGWYSLIDCAAKIKFRTFATFYKLNPDRWVLEDCGVSYKKIAGSYYEPVERFRFSFIDTLKYKVFLTKTNKQKARIKDAKALSTLIKCVQEDINKVEKQADNEREEGMHNAVCDRRWLAGFSKLCRPA